MLKPRTRREADLMVDPNRAKSIFLAASEKPRDDRAAFLNGVVNGDSELRASRGSSEGP